MSMILRREVNQRKAANHLMPELKSRERRETDCVNKADYSNMTVDLTFTWKENCVSEYCAAIEVTIKYYSSLSSPKEFGVRLYRISECGLKTCNDIKRCSPNSTTVRKGIMAVYEDMLPGTYCATVVPKGVPCEYFSYNKEVVEPPNDAISKVHSFLDDKLRYILVGVFLCLTSAAVLVYVGLKRRCSGPSKPPVIIDSETVSLIEEIQKAPMVKVFLLYYPDCIHHIDVVHQLASFLQCCNCEVSYDLVEKAEIATNKVSWLTSRLQGNFKILLINSRMAYLMQQQYIHDKKANKVGNLTSDVFIGAIAHIMHDTDLQFDYKKIHMVRPAYVMKDYVLKGICQGISYEISEELPMLLSNLFDLSYLYPELNESELRIVYPSLYAEFVRMKTKLQNGCKCCSDVIV